MPKEIFFPQENQKKSEAESLIEKNLEVVDLKPEKLKSEIPVIFAPGWSNSTETMKKTLDVLAEKGRRVVSLTHGRRTEILEGPEEYSKEELQKALALVGVMQEKGIEKADIVGYSEAGINALIAAEIFPEKFRNIVLINPAGMIGKSSIFNLISGFKDEIKNKINNEKDVQSRNFIKLILKDIAKHIVKNPAMSLREMQTISQVDISEMMKNARKNGIYVSVIFGAEDKIFSSEKIKKNMEEFTDDFRGIEGGHAEIIFNPEKYMDLVDEILEKKTTGLP